jgi:hypothetical protein
VASADAATLTDFTDFSDFTDAEFEQLVLANAPRRRRNQLVWEALLSEHVLTRTHSALVEALQRNTAAMTVRREAEESRLLTTPQTRPEHTPDYLAWRGRATAFRLIVESALSEVNKRRQQLTMRHGLNAAEHYRQQIRDLALAIAAHQIAATTVTSPHPHDTHLWDCLDTVHLPHGPDNTPTPLRTLINTLWYSPADHTTTI